MASKYMGAKKLQKAIKKKQEEAAKKGAKGTVHANAGEFLDRKKQKFDMSQSSMQVDGDFEMEAEEENVNVSFNAAYETLRKKDDFFFTYNENFIEDEEETDSENEVTKIQDMRFKAETISKSMY